MDPAAATREYPRKLLTTTAVGSRHGQVRLLFDRNMNAFGNMEFHGMRVNQRETDHFSLELGAVPDPDDVHIFLESGGDAGHGVSDQGARETMQGGLTVILANGVKFRALLLRNSPGRFTFILPASPCTAMEPGAS